jgi:flagellar biosynthesis GTPase FlhF
MWCRPWLIDPARSMPLPRTPEIARAALEVIDAHHEIDCFDNDPAFRDRQSARVGEHIKVLRRKIAERGLARAGIRLSDEVAVGALIDAGIITASDLARLTDPAWCSRQESGSVSAGCGNPPSSRYGRLTPEDVGPPGFPCERPGPAVPRAGLPGRGVLASLPRPMRPDTLPGSGSAQPACFRASERPAPTMATRTRVHDSCALSSHAIRLWRAVAGGPAGKRSTMTRNKAQKIATRQRMAETGEPYSVARHVIEDDQVQAEPPEPPTAGPNATARDDRWYARVAEEAGISVAEFKAQEAAARAADLADEAQQRADAAQERADQAQERAEQAQEAAELAQAAADLATEAAELTHSWADEQERERAQQRADQAQLAADRALAAAGLAQEQAEREQELAHRAEETADEAQERAEELAEGSDDEDDEGGPANWPFGDWGWGQAGRESPGHGPGLDWDRLDDLGDRMQARVARLRERFDQAREHAERLIGQAERIVNAAQAEPEHTDQG